MIHKGILCVALHRTNDFMDAADMSFPSKFFVELFQFQSTEPVNKKLANEIIEKSKSEEDFWIPAVIDEFGEVFADKSVKILSDGKQEIFLPRAGK